jgi:hypothetical protein
MLPVYSPGGTRVCDIRFGADIKGSTGARPPSSRLEWSISLADLLGCSKPTTAIRMVVAPAGASPTCEPPTPVKVPPVVAAMEPAVPAGRGRSRRQRRDAERGSCNECDRQFAKHGDLSFLVRMRFASSHIGNSSEGKGSAHADVTFRNEDWRAQQRLIRAMPMLLGRSFITCDGSRPRSARFARTSGADASLNPRNETVVVNLRRRSGD